MTGFRSTVVLGEVPGWFCLADPRKCVAEGPERGDAAPPRCPKCGAQIGVTIFAEDDLKNSSEKT